MCGIAGYCDFDKARASEEVLAGMANRMTNRGPDSSGFKRFNKDTFAVGLGHRRLSILDLSELGAQPMSYHGLHIIFNGEVYNFKEIRRELETLGYVFRSNSDTEVVLSAFHKWREKAVERFIGMFSFAIYDEEKATIHIFRDRAGVKPLYYYYENDVLLFASEIKAFYAHPAFSKKISSTALSQFFSYGYILHPYSIFEHTHKLSPGSYLTFDLKTRVFAEEKYWDVLSFYNKPKLRIKESEVVEEAEKLLISACGYRMVSDVPVGVFLSGGYDSTCVASLLQHNEASKINTFTIGFDTQGYDEAPFARKIAAHLGTNHTEHYCTIEDARGIIPLIGEMFDEPFGDSSAIPTYLVSMIARQHVTVALSADGGDEIFGGYAKYDVVQKYYGRIHGRSKAMRKGMSKLLGASGDLLAQTVYRNQYNFKTRVDKIGELLRADEIGEALGIVSKIFSWREVGHLLVDPCDTGTTGFDKTGLLTSSNEDPDKLMAIDYLTYMVDDILVKVDRATMAVSLEGREPLLDHRIVEFMAQVPPGIKLRNGRKKNILKQVVHKYVPEAMMDRPKQGFALPVFEWFKKDLAIFIDQYLNEQVIRQQGLFNWNAVNGLINEYNNGKLINAQKIWLLLSFQLWYEHWIKETH